MIRKRLESVNKTQYISPTYTFIYTNVVTHFRKSKHVYEQAEVPMDYFTECQQKQIYASMLRGGGGTPGPKHRCPPYPDVTSQTETDAMLPPCAHVDVFTKGGTAPEKSPCLAHSHLALRQPPSPMFKTDSNKFLDHDHSIQLPLTVPFPKENTQTATQSYI